MIEYEVEPKSREDIRRVAEYFRKILGIEDIKYVPIVEVLDALVEMDPEFTYEVVTDDQFPESIHADTDVISKYIRIKESVYDGACKGNGRDRMTIAHEIGHYILINVCGFRLHRKFNRNKIQAYRTPEWQAKCFAGELLMKKEHIACLSVDEIIDTCGVSKTAATYHYILLHLSVQRCA